MKRAATTVLLTALLLLPPAAADEPARRTATIRFTPAKRAQIALWIEKADGTFLKTIKLTQATATRGIGNRPGASQMNSGYRWPYGRREGVLPVWAHRRAAAPGATTWKKVIFQDRTSEGWASRSSDDASPDSYFCLSFKSETTRKDGLDAVSCASAFTSDKGRFLTDADVARGYLEPQGVPGSATTSTFVKVPLGSLYPPRRDVDRCTASACSDHADVANLRSEAARVMDLDAVSIATPAPDAEQTIVFQVPPDWPDGAYVAWIEINTEGDYNDTWNDKNYPTPKGTADQWDSWAMTFGYPFRGQPSIAYRLPFAVGGNGTFSTTDPAGYGSLSGTGADGGELHPMDGFPTNDPSRAPGSGADRLRLAAGRDYRLQIQTLGVDACGGTRAPGAPADLKVEPHPDEKHSHQWGHMGFTVPPNDFGIVSYEVRVGTEPITDEASFMRAQPANGATLETEELVVPAGGSPGSRVYVDFGGMMPVTHYWIGIRAIDTCNTGPIAIAELTTTAIHFTKLSGCFVATAAWGSPMASEIQALRRLRDRWLLPGAVGRGAVAVYEDVGPVLADRIRASDHLRAGVRLLLGPAIELARAADRLGAFGAPGAR